MRIVVNNEQERELVKRFLRMTYDNDLFNELERINIENDVHDLDSAEYQVLEWAFNLAKITIDKTEREMELDETDCITGFCRVCECQTEGMGDCHDDVTYSEYLRLMSADVQAEWICEDCQSNMCGCCGERLSVSYDYGECANCLYDFPEVF